MPDPGPYTTPDEVRQVDPAIDAEEDLTMAIRTAHSLVWDICAQYKAPLKPYSTEKLGLIEAWLAAHFFHINSPQASNEHAGPVSQGFQYFVSQDLRNTMFGQQAIMLDTNGGLAQWCLDVAKGKKTAAMKFLGTRRY